MVPTRNSVSMGRSRAVSGSYDSPALHRSNRNTTRFACTYAADGQFTDAASVRFPGLGDCEARHRLRFWLPFDAAWIRFDPSESAGTIHLGPIEAIHRSPAWAVLRGAVARLWSSPTRAWNEFVRILTAARRDRHERNRLLVALALPEQENEYGRWLSSRLSARPAEYPARADAGLFSLLTTVYDTPDEFIQILARSVLGQTWRDFEWVILDNGSGVGATRAALARACQRPESATVPCRTQPRHHRRHELRPRPRIASICAASRFR